MNLLSAAGVTELVDLRERLTRADAALAVAAAPPLVRRVLAITGLATTTTIIIITDSVDDALGLVAVDRSRRRPSLRVVGSLRSYRHPGTVPRRNQPGS